METKEQTVKVQSGWLWLFLQFMFGIGLGYLGYLCINALSNNPAALNVWLVVLWAIAVTVWGVLWGGFFTLEPNVGAVLTLFGKYIGTVREPGFHYANPFYAKHKVSLRAHNLNGEKLKVNDLRGNPIEIGVVVVWRVIDTAKAVFDVEQYQDYVEVQSEAALRHLAMAYPYDDFEGETRTLRGSTDEVSDHLQQHVQERVARAGVIVEEARLSHLAYAPEIAGAMLQRQQAEAIVAARQRIVDGAVGMVEMALHHLEAKKTVDLDPERKATMVSNLLVVLCSDRAVQPVINTGTIY